MPLWPLRRRKPRAASRIPTSTQRRIMLPPSQRFTRRVTTRMRPFMFSMGFVVEKERVRDGESPSPSTVSVSSSPSRSEPAALGCFFWSVRARLLSRRFAVSTFAHVYASRIAARTSTCLSSGRCPSTLRTLCTWHRCTRVRFPKTLRIAARRPLLPSMTNRRERVESRPREARFSSIALQAISFSVTFPEAENLLRARRVDAERAEDDVLAEVDAVDEHRPDVEFAQRPRRPLRELLRGERDVATAHGALARAACLDTLGERLERAAVLPGGDTDGHLLERAMIQRIGLRELAPGL